MGSMMSPPGQADRTQLAAAPLTSPLNNWAGIRGFFFEPAQKNVDTEFSWSGEGRGAYERVESYRYIGEGQGSFNRDDVQEIYYGWRPRKCFLFCLMLLGLVPLLLFYSYWLFPPEPPPASPSMVGPSSTSEPMATDTVPMLPPVPVA